MRSLRLSFTTLRSGLPALVSVALLPACSGKTVGDTTECVTPDAAVTDTSSAEIGFDLGVGDSMLPEWDAGGDKCVAAGGARQTLIVELPVPGTPADQGLICASSAPKVTSNMAARVSLTSTGPSTAVGVVALPPDLTVVGLPTIVVFSGRPGLTDAIITNVTAMFGGFRFDMTWPKPLGESMLDLGSGFWVRVTLEVPCESGTRTVESITDVYRCLDGNQLVWKTSGDVCVECRIIAEMAPSPIVSDNQGDDLPLGRVLRIRVVEVARAANGVLLFAENDGGEDAQYEWRVSGGHLQKLTDDLVFWTPPEGDAFGQVALWNDAGAAVENFLHMQVPA